MSSVSSAPTYRRWWPWLVVLALVIAGGVSWRLLGPRFGVGPTAKAQTPAHRSPDGNASGVPVTTETAATGDLPVLTNGIGTVQALNTVVVRTRIDGEVQTIAFNEGQIVQAGDVLVQIDPRPYQAALDQAVAKKAQDEAQLSSAQSDLGRTNQLASREFATRQLQDQQTANVGQVTAQVRIDQAAIDNAQTQLGYTTLKAPLTGRTGFRLVDQGNIVHASDTQGIVEIAQLSPISVVFNAPEGELDGIRKALAAGSPAVTALTPDGRTTLAQGTLTLINNEVDTATGTIKLKATFPNQQSELWPGQSVSTKLLVRTIKDAVLLSNDAIQRGPDSLYVWVVKPDNTVEQRKITGGVTDGTRQVVEGVKPGERVVVGGQYRLQPNVTVTASERKTEPGVSSADTTAKDG